MDDHVEPSSEGDLVVRPLLAGAPRLLPDVVIRPRVYLIMPVSCHRRPDVRIDLGEKTSLQKSEAVNYGRLWVVFDHKRMRVVLHGSESSELREVENVHIVHREFQ